MKYTLFAMVLFYLMAFNVREAEAKVYTRCDLARELKAKLKPTNDEELASCNLNLSLINWAAQ